MKEKSETKERKSPLYANTFTKGMVIFVSSIAAFNS